MKTKTWLTLLLATTLILGVLNIPGGIVLAAAADEPLLPSSGVSFNAVLDAADDFYYKYGKSLAIPLCVAQV